MIMGEQEVFFKESSAKSWEDEKMAKFHLDKWQIHISLQYTQQPQFAKEHIINQED